MPRTCGIHIDQRRFHVVVLDGGGKKHRVVVAESGEVAPGEDPAEAVAEALSELVKREALRVESVGLAIDSGLAAFRTLTVPFDDRSKIEEIIKFEIESEFPQWDIDDVVVDFLVLGTKPGVESQLLVTGVPKPPLEAQLAACERGGLEAQEAELDGTALFEAAHASGLLDPEAARVLVHVGDASTTVVVADGDRLAGMRAIRAGALPRASSAPVEPAEDEDGEDAEAPEAEDAQAEGERLARTAQRIRRELTRTIAGVQTEHPVDAVYVCGHDLAGLHDDGRLADVPVESLPAGVEGVELEPELAVAYGAALRAAGAGVLAPHLRREELRFTGKFERVELPMAVLALLLCTLLGVKLIITQKRIDWRDEGDVAAGIYGDMQVWLQYSNAYLLPDPDAADPYPGRLKNPPPEFERYLKRAERGEDEQRTKYGELVYIRRELSDLLEDLKRQLGHISDVPQPQSALQGTTLVLGVLESLGDRVGRFGIRSLSAEFRAGSGTSRSSDRVEVKLDMDFFAENDVLASEHHSAFMQELRSKEWCLDFEERPSEPFEGGGGVSYDGIRINVDVAKWLEMNDLVETASAGGEQS